MKNPGFNIITPMILMACLICSGSTAQSFQVHLDKPFYVVGETIQYHIYPDISILSDSMLIYVELYNPQGKLQTQHISRIKGNSIGGKINLSTTLPEAYYQFLCYAVWDDTQSDSTVIRSQQISIPVFNDLETMPSDDSKAEVLTDLSNEINALPYRFTLHSRTDSEVLLELNQPMGAQHPGEYSVSILQDYAIPLFVQHQEQQKVPAIIPSGFKARKQLTIMGTVRDPNTHKLIQDKNLSLYIPALKFFKRISAEHGVIKTDIPDLKDVVPIQILSMNPNSRYPLEVMFKTNFAQIMLIDHDLKPVRTPGILSILRQHGQKRLIHDIFAKHSPFVKAPSDSSIEFVPDRKYLLTDFQELTTLEEFIKEVLLDAHITRIINNNKSLRLRNKAKNELYKWPAWYLLDGIFQSDENAMLNFDITKIKSIELFHKEQSIVSQFDPIMRYNGIFSIRTYLQEEPTPYLYSLPGIQKVVPDENEVVETVLAPDLRSTLAWQTGLKTDEQGRIRLNFKTSDIKGKFIADLKGINGSGKPIHVQYSIIVD